MVASPTYGQEKPAVSRHVIHQRLPVMECVALVRKILTDAHLTLKTSELNPWDNAGTDAKAYVFVTCAQLEGGVTRIVVLAASSDPETAKSYGREVSEKIEGTQVVDFD